jgi:hypothetical protein
VSLSPVPEPAPDGPAPAGPGVPAARGDDTDLDAALAAELDELEAAVADAAAELRTIDADG